MKPIIVPKIVPVVWGLLFPGKGWPLQFLMIFASWFFMMFLDTSQTKCRISFSQVSPIVSNGSLWKHRVPFFQATVAGFRESWWKLAATYTETKAMRNGNLSTRFPTETVEHYSLHPRKLPWNQKIEGFQLRHSPFWKSHPGTTWVASQQSLDQMTKFPDPKWRAKGRKEVRGV